MTPTRPAARESERVVHLPLRAPRVPGFDVPIEGPPPPVARPRNAFADANREKKVGYLAIAACRLAIEASKSLEELVGAMEGWSDEEWRKLAVASGQKPPSDQSKALVLERLRARAARQTEVPPSLVTRYFVVRKPDPRYAWKHDIGATEGYATEAEAEAVAKAELARGGTTGGGFAEEIWVEERRV